MDYTTEMFENALKILQDETIPFTSLCNKYVQPKKDNEPEKIKEACRHDTPRRTCLLCAIFDAKEDIWKELNRGKEKSGNTEEPFNTYGMVDYYFKHVGRDKDGFPKQNREQAVILLTQMSRIFKDRGAENEEDSKEDCAGGS